eukprot:TRINITY_DN7508_c0_g1_i1.p1 TRINITY_DN7508_c0_g1~~TRINITY_DN7508_c0_g1_i1.p1  ORF type:complete len:822 (+),score=214.37 TRINITY_DN7508_c0_g1_i1:25-2466(+)
MGKKKGLEIRGSWRHIPLDPNLVAKGAKEGLLGIEELTDYTLLAKSNRGKPKRTSVKNAPRFKGEKDLSKKAKDAESEDEKEDASEVLLTKDKKKKKKTKKKKKDSSVPVIPPPELIEEVEESDEEELHFESDNDEPISYHSELPEWSRLHVPELVLRAIHELGFETPTSIQQLTLPAAISGQMDIVGAAETGSGKTLAFGIPILSGILSLKQKESEESESENEDLSDAENGEIMDGNMVEMCSDEELEECSDEELEDAHMEEEEGEGDNILDESDEFDENEGDEVLDESNESDENEGEEMSCVKVIDNADFGDLENGFLPKKIKLGRLYAVILTPTRELAVQIKDHINQVAKYTGIKTAVIVGGMAPQKQIRILSQCPEIVVATPGRLWDLMQQGNPHLSQIPDVKFLAIDETDRMVEKGHFEELQKLLELINSDENKKISRQTFVFSATLSLVHEPPKNHSKKKMKAVTAEEKLKALTSTIGVKEDRMKVVDITRKLGTAETLTESRIHCNMDEKDYFLYYILVQHSGRTIIFCNSIDCVRRLVNLFQYLLVEPMGLHAQMHQKQRLKNLERFSQNDKGILIATDVAARGLDIPNVEHVVHYQVPRTSESYIHRSGRTARANREGISVMFIDPKETYSYRKICTTLNRDKELPIFPICDELMPGVKERVNVARQFDKLSLVIKKEDVSKSWMKKAAEEADLEYVDSDEVDDEDETMVSSSQKRSDSKRKLEATKQRLHQLLLTPITRPNFSGKYPTKSGKLVMPTKSKETALSKLKNESENVKNLLKRKNKANGFKKNKKKKKKEMESAST